jgi:soluble lytic murein transglycosylase-like protein
MSVDIKDNLSLLTALLAKGPSPKAVTSADSQRDGIFSERLDRVLGGTVSSTGPTTQLKAEALAETLSLQMLQASLSLGEGAPERSSQLFDRQSPQFQSLIRAYTSNQPAAEQSTEPRQPAAVSQLQEMGEITANTPARPSIPTTQSGQAFESIISKASNRYGVDAGLIKAVIKAESSFNPNAVSHAGAQGLMQLMPGTARSLGVNDSFDPEQNVMGGTRFLRDLLKRYNGNLDSALAAYNWGPGNVDKRPGQLPRETRDYLTRVKQLYDSYTA